ncbi:MAG: hypothetical protein M1379_00325 [Firmicutes bacterium]|nr:hypothetical protein [Bacillota bacterium]
MKNPNSPRELSESTSTRRRGIYRRLGFKDIGPWLVLELQKNNPGPSPEIMSAENNMG